VKRAGHFIRIAHTEISTFFGWWVQELREWGEAILGRIAPRLLTRTVIHIDSAGEPVGLTEALRNTRAIIVMPPAHVLTQEISLPDSVERDLDSMIALHLERELPLRRERVHVDYGVVSRSREERRITLRLFVARRDDIAKLRERAEAWGVRLIRVGILDEAGRIVGNFLRTQTRFAGWQLSRVDRRLIAMTAALVMILITVVMGQWIYERVEAGREANRLGEAADRVHALARRLSRESAPAEALSALMSKPDATDVLISLTASVPADSWVYDLQVDARSAQSAEIKLSGYSAAATALVDALEKLPQLEKVQLQSAQSAGLGSAQDRLQLVAIWSPAGARP
jgi:hypothetical protein